MADAKVQLKEIYPIPEKMKKKAWISGREAYDKLWKQSVEEPGSILGGNCRTAGEPGSRNGTRLWITTLTLKKVPSTLNSLKAANSMFLTTVWTRHLEKRGNQVAIQWEGNEPGEEKAFTYKMLHEEVCKFANVLKAQGVKKGDRVCSLHADGSRTGHCHAGLLPHRRHSWHRFRRIQR